MKTDIEKILRENKAKLDFEKVPEDTWEGIRNSIQKRNKSEKSFQFWKVAAVVFMAVSIGLLADNISLLNQVEELASLGDISQEYSELEMNYEFQINQLTSQFSIDDAFQTEDLNWMAKELDALEKVNQQYRQDIGTEADQELLVEALIDYYEKKIRLLRKIELEINRQQNEERTTNTISAS